ncbi:uncharacterized protein Smp_201530 [Schistosoma mansoni]|uniref:Smp_201530 n=1 Tax=Schistosoma mansoni TaxID=6183 RepID=G4VCD9_SCHMA|nr:uncharacterized protein Smp_201530 [Schistosoma mansoni]|eukprot:XP_018650187.1 uncharacterized protein Smp_201530 [Schistosoma mansoni]
MWHLQSCYIRFLYMFRKRAEKAINVSCFSYNFSFSDTLRNNMSVQSKTMILIMNRTIYGCILASYIIFIDSLALNCFNLQFINNYQHPCSSLAQLGR